VRYFERQFQVDGDVARNRSLDRWIGERCSYNFAARSFHTKKLCSRLFLREVEFYWHKQRYRVSVPFFEGLRGNVHGSSMARWKARGRLPIRANWTFFSLAITVEALWADIRRNRYARKGGGSLSAQILGRKGRLPPTIIGIRKLESLGYRMVKKLPKIATAWVGRTNVTDRQTTDRWNCDSI